MKCPKCGIRAARNAISCFCGHEFTDRSTANENNRPDKKSAALETDENNTKTEETKETEETGQQTEPGNSDDDVARNASETKSTEETDNTAPGTVEADIHDEAETTEAADIAPAPRFDDTVPRYDRVGGWLLLLCVSLTILGPLATFYNLTTGYSEVQELFDATPGLRTLYSSYSVLSAGLGLFSLWAGFSLWTRMDGAVERAKKYLYAVLGYSIILYFLPTMAGLPEEMSTEMQNVMAIASFRSIIYVAIWYLYLTKSKRVRGTYPI